MCLCVRFSVCGCVQDFGSVFTLHYLQEIFFGIFKRENLFFFFWGKRSALEERYNKVCVLCGKF